MLFVDLFWFEGFLGDGDLECEDCTLEKAK